jgi:hypothetical protein
MHADQCRRWDRLAIRTNDIVQVQLLTGASLNWVDACDACALVRVGACHPPLLVTLQTRFVYTFVTAGW